MPLNILIDKRASENGYGLWSRAFERNGLRNLDKMAVIKHPAYFPKKHWFQKIGIQRRRYVSALEETENQIKVLEKYDPQAIKSYPSCMAEIARTLKKRRTSIKPRLIFTGGELLNKEARTLISSVFETEPLDTYGTTEFSLVAWECREHSGYHINADSVLMEFLDGEEEVAAGERGAVVCTGFNNYAMPLIRYKDNDIAVPLDEECSCGVKLPLLRNIEGRESDLLMAIDGHLVSPWHFFPFPFKDYAGIRQFKIIQDRKDRILLQVVAETGTVDEYRLNEASKNMRKLFGEEMRVDFEFVDELEMGPTGKIRAISRLF
jgi:phenylacetate-CoA ligase